MSNPETLYQNSISIRQLPINFDRTDLALFQRELKKDIPATKLLRLQNVNVNPDGIIFRGTKIFAESFASPKYLDAWLTPKAKLKFFVKNYLFKDIEKIDSNVFWFTDNWSDTYFHWITDALPRLFSIREKIVDGTLLLPASYQEKKYITSSLSPFVFQEVKFVNHIIPCKNLHIPTHTAPTGNYNEALIKDLRSFYTDFYSKTDSDSIGDKVYISRSKAPKRKIQNEEECLVVLKEYGFKVVYFEDYSFEQQVKICLDARYLISNHGAGLTNMLFMKSGSSVFELRKKADIRNNCFFSLASALNLKYFYQICDSENPDEDAHTANLIVDCKLLRKN